MERERYWKAEKRDVDLVITNAPSSDSIDDPVVRDIHRAMGTPLELAIQGEVILMSRMARVSNADIARKLSKEVSTLRSILSWALARLARELI